MLSNAERSLTQEYVCSKSVLTPSYKYDIPKLRERIQELIGVFQYERFALYFATMANDDPVLLKEIAGAGVGACVNSLLHLRVAREAGFSLAKIQCTSTGLSGAVLEELRALGIRVNVDSLG